MALSWLSNSKEPDTSGTFPAGSAFLGPTALISFDIWDEAKDEKESIAPMNEFTDDKSTRSLKMEVDDAVVGLGYC
jgi:hypothetical protein